MLPELEGEHVAARERVDELLAEWELLNQ